MNPLGLGTYALAWSIGVPGHAPAAPLDAFAFLGLAHEWGLKRVQIADNLPLHQLPLADQERLLALAYDLDIAVEVGTRGIQPHHLRGYLALARAFRSPILRVVVDTAEHQPDVPEILDILRPLLPEFTAANVVLAIENHDRFKAQTLADLITALDSPYVGICLDTVNSFGSLEGPQVVLDTLGRFVVNLHVKDFRIRRVEHHMGFVLEGTPAGAGMLDLPWLLRQLPQRPFSAILELWPAPEATLEATIAKERDWAVQSVHTLRQWFPD